MRLNHTTVSEDRTLDTASDNRDLVGGLLDIIERFDSVIYGRLRDIQNLENEVEELKRKLETLES